MNKGNFREVDPKQSLPKMEEEILKFWQEEKIFEKSLDIRKDAERYSFYDGPPFATGTPHYGHIVASIMKDVVPRFWTMKGKYVERKWGWDCHGLPIENIVEKELGFKSKKDIEKLGIEKFNEICRSKVLSYVAEWRKVIGRLGRWADMDNAYKTMDLSYMESVWWVFKELWDKGLIYEGYRSMHICPRCETTLSQQEVAEGYKTIKDLSAVAKFELISTNYESDTKLRTTNNEKIYILAWTTTPWTLIGNVALAIGKDIDYVRVKTEKEIYILAKSKLADVMKENKYEILEEFKGEKLIGKKYKPLFDYYYADENLKDKENGWQIYPADFVTTEEGTGVVHIAPAFGEDDMELGKKFNLPFIQHLGMDGIIKSEAKDFAGLSVKPIEDNQKTDVEIIKYLAKNNLLFSKEKFEHSYPHCWRCDTPLINYATSSWFVKVTGIKEKALELAKNINWTPKHIKDGRFGNWMEGARDWSISRQRFWASVMPIWKCEKCAELKVVGSVDEIREQFGNPNKLFIIRHGEAENNVQNIISSYPEKNSYSLTQKGKEDIEKISEELKSEKMDIILCSPLQRTKETAQIISEKIGAEIIFDEQLRETDFGKYNGAQHKDARIAEELYKKDGNEEGVESNIQLKKRIEKFITETNKKYQGKNIVIVSHGAPIRMIEGVCSEVELKEIEEKKYPKTGKKVVVYSKNIDLHKHIVDKITFPCEKCDGVMKRVPDVLDTWFDSGSMPYAQIHYPFDPSSISSQCSDNYGARNKEKISESCLPKGFPAEFIAEGIDQTRAWFYYIHVLSSAIMEKNAFQNVVVNGMVLAEDGKKMAKRLKNYPDPASVLEKYGADALRYYLLSSPVMAAEDLNFKESDVADAVRGMLRMLWNSYSFFVLYANVDGWKPQETRNKKQETNNLLDKWIVSELNMLMRDVNTAMENYELNRAVRCFPKFIDNLSNWYIRRSRKRFWKSENDEDKNNAYQTLHYVLVELAKTMAPFMPFIAEEIFKNLTGKESVHLENFPVADEKLIDEKLNEEMQITREIITEALQLRAKAGIKVRQPLPELRVTSYELRNEFIDIIKDEVNVKDVVIEKDSERKIKLNTEITPELKLEGQAREIVRFIQEMRKEAGYVVDNRISVGYVGGEGVFEKFGNLIAKEVLANEIRENMTSFDLEKEFTIDGEKIKVQIKK
jgi:isoleucyl-tRNA synthetase